MGHSSSKGVKAHIETAQKTGALVLSNQKLDEVPDLSSLAKILRTLDLAANKLSILPSSLFALENLRNFSINCNKIGNIPEDIKNLKKLESLNCRNNQISRLPSSFSALNNLKSLVLSHNNFTEFPIIICHLNHLDAADLSFNKIHSIPDGIKSLQATELNLNNNQVSRISEEISHCQRLKTLRLEENVLELNAVPDRLLKQSNVSLLCLNGNLFNMKQLEDLASYSEYMERYTAVKKKMY